MLLAIDTATSRASIALHDGHSVRGECTWEASNRHTVTLLPHIVQMLKASGITADDLELPFIAFDEELEEGGGDDLFIDAAHITEEGHQIIGEKLARELKQKIRESGRF